MNLIITRLSKKVKKYVENKKIQDIVLFGSLLKGKETPSDTDILIIFKNNIDKDLEYEIKKDLRRIQSNTSLISTTQEELYKDSFFARDAIFFEGYSLLNNEYIAKKQGYTPMGLFKYETKKLDNTKKTTFYYALNGRNNSKGLIDKYGLVRMSNNSILAPLNKISLITEFLEKWTEYKYFPILIPTRLSKKELLEK